MRTLISIVTPCLNRREFVTRSIESLLAQDQCEFEHIVVDGGSTDGTLDVLSSYRHLRVISGPDEGIYDALNKGIAACRGDIVGWLNSDDEYLPDALAAVTVAFERDLGLDSVCGTVEVNNEGVLANSFAAPDGLELDFRIAVLGAPVINARFFRRSVYERVGTYNLAYPLSADREFLVRSLLASVTTRVIDTPVYRYHMHKGSATFNHENRNALVLSCEYIKMADRWLDAVGLPTELTVAFRRLRGEAYGRIVAAALFSGDIRGALQALMWHKGLLSLSPSADVSAAIWGRARNQCERLLRCGARCLDRRRPRR